MEGQSTTKFDVTAAITTMTRFLTGNLLSSGLSGFVVGLSGGIDSAVAAAIAVKAVGGEKVLGLLMPYRSSSPESIEDAKAIAEFLGIEHRLIDISPMIDAWCDKDEIDESSQLRAGNKMARERMSLLFDAAHQKDRLVLGTGNRTEICLGYTTLFGDAACSLNPIGGLYKTELRAVARELGLPEAVLTKAPSADLWPGQTDEQEIGLSYEIIDRLLRRIVDEGCRSMAQLESEGFDATDISRVVSLMNKNAFKRYLPPVASFDKVAIPPHIALEP